MANSHFNPYIVDAHQDLGWNMLVFHRDYSLSVREIRKKEIGTPIPAVTGDAMVGWPEYHRGHIGLVFGTLFATPKRKQEGELEAVGVYEDARQAAAIDRQELALYQRLIEEHPARFAWVRNQAELADLFIRQQSWNQAFEISPENLPEAPVGLVLLMEGAEAISGVDDLESWWQDGLRIIGPAWAGTRFCGGTQEPGPLTREGRRLLENMAEIGFILDISHMDGLAADEALDRYPGRLICSHSAPQRLLKNLNSNRFLSDDLLQRLIERDAVIGITAYNHFLSQTWKPESPREEVSLQQIADQIDVICQTAGDSRHAGIGSDLDGGFGFQSTPGEMQDVSDLQKLAAVFQNRGYSVQDIQNIMGQNWISALRKGLPEK